MIAKMLKVYCAARARDRERLVDALGDLGAVHLVPVDPAKAAADAGTSASRVTSPQGARASNRR